MLSSIKMFRDEPTQINAGNKFLGHTCISDKRSFLRLQPQLYKPADGLGARERPICVRPLRDLLYRVDLVKGLGAGRGPSGFARSASSKKQDEGKCGLPP